MDEVQNFFNTSVTIKWNSTGAGNFYVGQLPTVANGYLVVNRNSPSKREIIKYTGTGTDGNGPFITVLDAADRGLGGTTAQTHEVGETVQMTITAQHWSDLIETLDGIVNDGAPTATTTVRGIVKMNTTPADPADPIVVGPNDPLLDKPTGEPTAFVTESAGAADEGKGVKLNEEGEIDNSIRRYPFKRIQYDLADSPATWTKPAKLSHIKVELWGGGGSGAGTGTASRRGGGGGGAYVSDVFFEEDLSATETITIALGGASVTDNANGLVGGNSTFGSLLTAYGGGGGRSMSSTSLAQRGGGGGGAFSVGLTNPGTGGGPLGGIPGGTNQHDKDSAYGGGAGGFDPSSPSAGNSYYGGGGGIGGSDVGGNSHYGGGGGARTGSYVGVSVRGGNGGAESTAGVVPAGGGGAGTTSGAGAAGRCIITEYYN